MLAPLRVCVNESSAHVNAWPIVYITRPADAQVA